jgi:hypothetical protein
MPVLITIVISHEWVLRDGTTIGHVEPAVWAATTYYKKPET